MNLSIALDTVSRYLHESHDTRITVTEEARNRRDIAYFDRIGQRRDTAATIVMSGLAYTLIKHRRRDITGQFCTDAI